MKLAICMALIALSGCASQQRHSSVDFSPSDRAAMVSALLAHQQPLSVYQQPFYPMQPIPVARPCCWY
jgi:hypothetical protein